MKPEKPSRFASQVLPQVQDGQCVLKELLRPIDLRHLPNVQRQRRTTLLFYSYFFTVYERTTAPRLLATSSVTGACRQVNNAKSKTVCLRRLRSTNCISTRGSVTCILQKWQSILRRCQYYQSSPGEGECSGPKGPCPSFPALPFFSSLPPRRNSLGTSSFFFLYRITAVRLLCPAVLRPTATPRCSRRIYGPALLCTFLNF